MTERAPYLEWTAEEISEAAAKIVSGRGWVSLGVDVSTSFGMLLAVTPKEMVPDTAVGMYADYEVFPPMPVGVNGMPVFSGGRFINGDDALALVHEIEEREKVALWTTTS